MYNALRKLLQQTLNCLLQKMQDGYCVYVTCFYTPEVIQKIFWPNLLPCVVEIEAKLA